ncbi:hypothetical protein [Pseudonocardia sp. KRD291]|uniref:hypothetical protein n=1 Tax=Pseudonocardia sp. KRD291 TaxID=2792007 RepID=UPI001C4A4BF7|nr:hypothetical protein [Pseudonocardia sp. KRD291]MBW0101950.1 hypothetical protein [Pseudonocardia sp. KRD291]
MAEPESVDAVAEPLGPAARVQGSLRGRILIAADADETDEELAELMESGPVFPDEQGSR